MRIGELLVEQRKLRQSDLARALAEKPANKRLVSFLIAKGLVDFDDASRALGEQKSVACALAKHLAARDPSLATLIPAELGRSACVLPIGKTSKGSLIVCVRDPDPPLLRMLQQAIRGDVLMVVAPANRLEHLITEAYGTASTDELDVDFDIPVQATPVPTRSPRPVFNTPPVPFQHVEEDKTPLPPLPDMDALDPESIRLSLTDLDDARVEKDPTQSGQFAKTAGSLPGHPPSTPPPVGSLASSLAAGTLRGKDARATRAMTIEMMQVGLDSAMTREAATDLVLAFVATRWHVGLVLAVRDKAAIGYRGHNVIAPESVTVSLGSPSTIQRAVATRFVSKETPSGVGQAALTHALSGPSAPAAAPVIVGGQPVAVIAVGDPLEGPDAVDKRAADLAMVAEALGAAYARILAR